MSHSAFSCCWQPTIANRSLIAFTAWSSLPTPRLWRCRHSAISSHAGETAGRGGARHHRCSPDRAGPGKARSSAIRSQCVGSTPAKREFIFGQLLIFASVNDVWRDTAERIGLEKLSKAPEFSSKQARYAQVPASRMSGIVPRSRFRHRTDSYFLWPQRSYQRDFCPHPSRSAIITVAVAVGRIRGTKEFVSSSREAAQVRGRKDQSAASP